jgi:hypothetical protein
MTSAQPCDASQHNYVTCSPHSTLAKQTSTRAESKIFFSREKSRNLHCPAFDKNTFPEILKKHYGTWRSLVARFLGVEEAVSSNLAVPTIRKALSRIS